jgi:hypothetical protein
MVTADAGWGLADAARRRLARVCRELDGSRDLIIGLAEGKIPPLVVHVLEGPMSDEDEPDSQAGESGSTDRPTQGVSPNRLEARGASPRGGDCPQQIRAAAPAWSGASPKRRGQTHRCRRHRFATRRPARPIAKKPRPVNY